MRLISEKTAVSIPKLAGSVILFLLFLGFLACDHTVDYETNSPLDPPSDPIPADGSSDQNISLQLSWTCSDPDSDSLIYDLFLGYEMELSASLAASSLTQSHFIPNELLPDTTYYWKVIARNNNGHVAESPLWSFSTGNQLWTTSIPTGSTVSTIPDSITWSCNALDGDSLTYDLYMGLDSDPTLIISAIEQGIYKPGWQERFNARQILYEIYAAEREYRWSNNTYWYGPSYASAANPDAFQNIDVSIPAPDIYTYCIRTADAVNLVVDAMCGIYDDDYDVLDKWCIDQNGQVTLLENDLKIQFDDNAVFYWKIVAVNEDGDSVISPIWNFTTDVNRLPETPLYLSPGLHASDPTMETILTWDCFDPNGEFLLYDIYFGLTPDPPLARENHPLTHYYPGWSKQKESWDMLLQIYGGQQNYFEENNVYFDGPGPASAYRPEAFYPIGVEIPTSALYSYCITQANATDLLVTATCSILDDDAIVDIWQIDENGIITSYQNDFDNPGFYMDTTYYWRVVAKDSYGGETVGPVWSFTTAGE